MVTRLFEENTASTFMVGVSEDGSKGKKNLLQDIGVANRNHEWGRR
jgi:hypothetical protein